MNAALTRNLRILSMEAKDSPARRYILKFAGPKRWHPFDRKSDRRLTCDDVARLTFKQIREPYYR